MDHGARKASVERFEELILVHLTPLYRAALRLTGKAQDAEDLVQETCLRAFQALDQLQRPGAAKVWLFSILRSVFLRQVRRAPSPSAMVSLDDLDASGLLNDALGDLVEPFPSHRQALLHATREATLKLPVPYREAIVLAHIGGFSYREMARILEIPIGTVMSRLFRARRMLRACLREGLESRRGPEPVR